MHPSVLLITFPVAVLSLLALLAGAWLAGGLIAGVFVGTALLIASVSLLALSLAGRFVVLALFGRAADDEPRETHAARHRWVQAADGTQLSVEIEGRADGPTVVLTHGWGADATAWYYQRRALARSARVVSWDLRGLGRSETPANRDFDLATMADDLGRVLDAAGGGAILVGHSIGGMLAFTLARIDRARFSRHIRHLAVVDTTHRDPLSTTAMHGLLPPLRPLVSAVAHLVIWIAPLMWLANRVAYVNGTTHLIAAFTGFGGSQTRGQLDRAAWLTTKASPATLARGILAMLRYDAIDVPTSLRLPATVIVGDRDRITIPEAHHEMAHDLGAALVTASRAGHMAIFERHDVIDEALTQVAQANVIARTA